mmetsp:Transcript_16641/g.33542  ORF Transcript_16641/g.33542 Transcript_16641/m.33542 type:complete len:129 (-) Transcript_16641:387-773(-)
MTSSTCTGGRPRLSACSIAHAAQKWTRLSMTGTAQGSGSNGGLCPSAQRNWCMPLHAQLSELQSGSMPSCYPSKVIHCVGAARVTVCGEDCIEEAVEPDVGKKALHNLHEERHVILMLHVWKAFQRSQ